MAVITIEILKKINELNNRQEHFILKKEEYKKIKRELLNAKTDLFKTKRELEKLLKKNGFKKVIEMKGE